VRQGKGGIGADQLFGKTASPISHFLFDLPMDTREERLDGQAKNHLVGKSGAEIGFPSARFVLTHRGRAPAAQELCHLPLGQRGPQSITAEVMCHVVCHKLIVARPAPNAELRPSIYVNKTPPQEVEY
jgi:hypothetical protein